MRLLLIFIFFVISNCIFSQNCDYLWDNGLWKKYLKQGADSNGIFSKHYLMGQKKIEGTYKNGIPIGKWTFWKKNGKLKAESDYNGEIKIWNHTGKYWFISVVGQFENGKRIGIWNEYDNDSTCGMEMNYNDTTYRTYTFDLKRRDNKDSVYIFQNLTVYDQDDGGFHFEVGYGKHYLKEFYFDSNDNYADFIMPESKIIFNTIDFVKYSLVGDFSDVYFTFNYTNYFNYLLTENNNKYTLHGNNVMFNLGGDAIYVNTIDFAFLAGVGIGNIKLDKYDIDGNITKYRNPSLLLNLMSDFRINLPLSNFYELNYKLGIGARIGIQTDLSDKRWKNKTENIKLENRWTMTGYYWQVFVSLGLY